MPDRPRRGLPPSIGPALGLALAGLGALQLLGGCRLGPRAFEQADDPSPIVRARALTLGDNVVDEQAIPVLIGRLDDPDHVVRMTANEELKRRTGQDFGFRPWAEPGERLAARGRWHAWYYGPPRQSATATPQMAMPPMASPQGAMMSPVPSDVGAPPPRVTGGAPR